MPQGGCFCTFPMIATQATSKSDIATQMNEKGEIVPLEGEQNQAPFLEHRFAQRVALSTVGVKLMGGLGNQLFIISNAIAYSLKHGKNYCIPRKVINPHYENQQPYNFPGVNYCSNGGAADLILDGYWQSDRYIEPYRKEILKAFGFDNIETKEGVCSLHYRSGDYKLYPTMHPVVSQSYLMNAISHAWLNNYRKFMVFSDDIPAIREIIESTMWPDDMEFEYSEGRTELEDLREMASCAANITANSSMSWWAAWINPNPRKIVIMPERWFGPDLNHDTKDLYQFQATVL